MRKLLFSFLCLTLVPFSSYADDKYDLYRNHSKDGEIYNERTDAIPQDYKNDKKPGYGEPSHMEKYKHPALRDDDHDGIPNYSDPYDKNWYKDSIKTE